MDLFQLDYLIHIIINSMIPIQLFFLLLLFDSAQLPCESFLLLHLHPTKPLTFTLFPTAHFLQQLSSLIPPLQLFLLLKLFLMLLTFPYLSILLSTIFIVLVKAILHSFLNHPKAFFISPPLNLHFNLRLLLISLHFYILLKLNYRQAFSLLIDSIPHFFCTLVF